MLLVLLLLTGCEDKPWNNPYPFEKAESNTLYLALTSHPKNLDPAISYSEPAWQFICQIYEPPLQYHYLKRPFVLEPLTANSMPEVRFYNAALERIPESQREEIAFSEYWITIKPGIYYQNHPAFAKNSKGEYLYQHLTLEEALKYEKLSDFKEKGTKELTAEDYVYQIKRLTEPRLSSPIFGMMSQYIVGFNELREQLLNIPSEKEIDLRPFELEGAKVIDKYTYRIRLKKHYPQFRFWLAMPFFAPLPAEVALFYAQPGLQKHNISLSWYPVGTGPYEIQENNPDRRMTLVKNTLYRKDYYPTLESSTEPLKKSENKSKNNSENLSESVQQPATSQIPAIDKAIYTLEKEHIPYWHKFLQGYYDVSGISSDNFTTAIQINAKGEAMISPSLKEQKIRLVTAPSQSLWSWGFNMLDETVGQNSEKSKILRHVINDNFDVQYFIDIFLNGRGILAKGPIPPQIFGYEAQFPSSALTLNNNINEVNKAVQKEEKIKQGKEKLKKAGFKPGFKLFLDTHITGGPEEIAMHTWLVEQFRKLDIDLEIRGSDFNRFQQKLKLGTAQIFFWGWNADYPDPENFLFLFYGPNRAAELGGENVTNYQNPIYDKLFEKMRILPDGPERFSVIQQMIALLQADQPAVFGFYPKAYSLYHQWMRESKPNGMINNNLKYAAVNPTKRATYRIQWNQPMLWPFVIFIGLILILSFSLTTWYQKMQQKPIGRI